MTSDVEPGDKIKIGTTPAIVCTIHAPGDIEVVYIDNRKHAISEDAFWDGAAWQFKITGSGAGKYADKTPRLQDFVAQLRADEVPPSNVRPTRFR